jgi:hypothetical protein
MPAETATEVQVGWWVRVRGAYARDRKWLIGSCIVAPIVIMGLWLNDISPVMYEHAVTVGSLTQVRCTTKGPFFYSYDYTVGNVRYTGESNAGNVDGNPGSCSSGRIGAPVWVTYNPSHPERSISGTLRARLTSSLQRSLLLSLGIAAMWGPMGLLKDWQAQRSPPSRPVRVPGPESRQQRRARERRERRLGQND